MTTPSAPRAGASTSSEPASPWHVALVTIFPELFDSFFSSSLVGKAVTAGRICERRVTPRRYTHDVHHTVDDAPYGGGAGMIMKPEPLGAAIREAHEALPAGSPRVLLTPQGRPLTQRIVAELAHTPGLVLICGRYEGIDDRVRQTLVDDELSLGDYVLSGGEVAAMVVIEAVSRLLPGVLGNADSSVVESFSQGVLEYPQFTRPARWEGHDVPEILLSGDHARIRDWRRAQALWRTRQARPDLWATMTLREGDGELMARYAPADGERARQSMAADEADPRIPDPADPPERDDR